MREALGDSYVEALRKAWKGDVPESSDFVMFWWQKAAELVRDGKAKRFGFITTNSIHQTFNRRVIEPFLEGRDAFPTRPANEKRMTKPKKSPKDLSLGDPSSSHSLGPFGKRSLPLHLAYAIPDHPWIDSADGAAVRIAMTVAAPGRAEGRLERVVSEHAREDGENEVTLSRSGGVLAANLQIGADIGSCKGLASNADLSNRGFCLFGAGFIIAPEVAETLSNSSASDATPVIWNYRNGKDLTNRPRGVMVIDEFPFPIEELQAKHPGVYQHLLVHVKPERDHNAREGRKKLWWAFGEPNKKLREQLADLPRYIATVETSKHRFFTFLDQSILPDNKLIAIASDDAFVLGVLSSFLHVTWSLAIGSRLEDRPVYVKTTCFDPFPFPALEEGELKQRIRDLGERLDAHRKRQQAQYPDLTLTGIYNVLQKIRSGEALNPKDKTLHDQGLVSVLKQIHDDFDAAVLEAYGWADCSGDHRSPRRDGSGEEDSRRPVIAATLLTRLVALNHERAAEEKRGHVRWLRPDFQRGGDHRSPSPPEASIQEDLVGTETSDHSKSNIQNSTSLPAWPESLPEQVAVLRKLLPTVGQDPETLAACFGRKNKKRTDQITAILATLKALGHIN